MSEKFRGKYRNDSARLKNWDYGSDAAYFITICTQNRAHYFGEIENDKMDLTPAGAIAYVLWQEIKNHAKNIELGEFVIMPNHVHGVLILDGNDNGLIVGGNGGNVDGFGRDVACNVPTIIDGIVINDCIAKTNNETNIQTSTPSSVGDTIPNNKMTAPAKNEYMSAISPTANTISTIVRSYKSAVTKYCNRLQLPFQWQSRFHDHIIRDQPSFERISTYIKNNIANWKDDRFF